MRPNRRGNAEEFRPVRRSVLRFSRRDTAAARAIRAQLQAAGVPAGEPRSLPKRERRGEVPYRALRPEVTSVGMSGGVSNAGQNGPDPMGAACRVLGQVERATCCLGDTKEYGSSWIFEPCLTWANALRRVQHPGFSLVGGGRAALDLPVLVSDFLDSALCAACPQAFGRRRLQEMPPSRCSDLGPSPDSVACSVGTERAICI